MKIATYLSALFLCFLLFAQTTQTGVVNDFALISDILGQPGKTQRDGTQKYSWPRSDLKVTANGVQIEPAFALSSWASFKLISKTQAITMGDLVLLPAEVNPVIRKLQIGDLDILAVHNHLFGETPEVVYVHFTGRAQPEQLAASLREALLLTKTPLEPRIPLIAPSPAIQKAFETIQNIIGKKGNISGKVLQIAVSRRETIMEDGMEIPSSMGMATSMNFQAGTENRIAATGDFVLVADEVNLVIKELEAHGIDITALHTHMLKDSPHLFFMHFWALDTADHVAAGLKVALARTNVKAD